MSHSIFRAGRSTTWFLIGLIVLVAVLMTGVTTVLVTASSTGASPPSPYVALGDSVAFGSTAQNSVATGNPDNVAGYPEDVGRALRFDTVNAACPGEATGGFISADGFGNNCSLIKANVPLHVAYTGTQLDFATAFLHAHPNTKLVTIGLGLNDIYILGSTCGSTESPQTCFTVGLPGVLATMASNMHLILDSLRGAGFHGMLIVVNNYSVDYSDPDGTALTQIVNDTVATVAQHDGAVVADTFSAFRAAAAATPAAGNNTCMAGLLNASPDTQITCDNQPSQSGQELLARTVLHAYATATGHTT